MRISKEILIDLACLEVGEGFTAEDKVYEVVEKTLDYTSRWSAHYSQVIKVLDNTATHYFKTSYSRGATERQSETPYEHTYADKNGTLEVTEVVPQEVTTTIYVTK